MKEVPPPHRHHEPREGVGAAFILLRARGEVLEEKNIKKSKGAMFAYPVKKHVRTLSPSVDGI